MTSPVASACWSRLSQAPLVPVVVLEDAERAIPLAEALLEAGLPQMEITFRTAAAADAILRISTQLPEMLVGAGTLLNAEAAERAVNAGSRFGVAPGFNPAVVARAQALRLPFMPGIATPTELEAAMAMDCDVLKFFPAQQAGGVSMLKAMLAAYGHTGVRFMPTGGVDQASLPAWLALPQVLAVGGSWMVEKRLIEAGDWSEVARRTREALAVIREVRP